MAVKIFFSIAMQCSANNFTARILSENLIHVIVNRVKV